MLVPARAALGAVLGLVLLAGCSASTTPTTAPATTSAAATASTDASGQTAAQACTALQNSLNDSANAMKSAMSEVTSDPSKAAKALDAFRDTFEQATADVTNPTVKAQAEKALAATKKMAAALEAVVNDPTKISSMQDAMTEFQTEMSKMGTVCP